MAGFPFETRPTILLTTLESSSPQSIDLFLNKALKRVLPIVTVCLSQ